MDIDETRTQSEPAGPPLEDWAQADPAARVTYLLQTHEPVQTSELARLEALAAQLEAQYGDERAELHDLRCLLEALCAGLRTHLRQEQQVLFPYMERLSQGEPHQPAFHTVHNPILVLQLEHEQVASMLRRLEQRTDYYSPPSDCCAGHRALYDGLRALHRQVHRQFHLESHDLFPAAVELERSVRSSAMAQGARR